MPHMYGHNERRSVDRHAHRRRAWRKFLDILHGGPSQHYPDVLDQIELTERTRVRWEQGDRLLLDEHATAIGHEAHVLGDGRLVLMSSTGDSGHAFRINPEEWRWQA
jgi:hypothetical protein